jgi:predicted nucleic acid-binding protein
MGRGLKAYARHMNRILVDTSVWIDFLNGKKNKQTTVLTQLIEEDFAIAICPTIIQEILQGIRDDKGFKLVKESLSGFELLVIDPVEAAHGAASLYREIRKKGLTIRKSNDCLIAFYAIFYKIPLLHKDEDFNRISKYSELKLVN